MLQAIQPAIQNIARNPNVQKAGFAILCGVGTFYTIKGTESARTSLGSWLTTKREALKQRRAERKANKEAEKQAASGATTTPDAPEVVVPEVVVSAEVPVSLREKAEAASQLEDAIEVVVNGATFNQLRAKCAELGLKFKTPPRKRDLAEAIVRAQTA